MLATDDAKHLFNCSVKRKISETAFSFPCVLVDQLTTDQTVPGSSLWDWRIFFYLRLRQMEGTLNQLWYFLNNPMLN